MAEGAKSDLQAVAEHAKPLEVVAIAPPPPDQRRRRDARPPRAGERATRYTLPSHLSSSSPIGYRTRLPFSLDEARALMPLLSLARPTAFVPGAAVREGELFEECSLGILSARQSTNYRGHRDVLFGPRDSQRIASLLERLSHRDAAVLGGASHTHVILTRPYRTPFTMLLTLVGHSPWTSVLGVAGRAVSKRLRHTDDIPTIGYLPHLHLGILADGMERAALVASSGRRRAQVHLAPFASPERRAANGALMAQLGDLCGVTPLERSQGVRVAMVAQVGEVTPSEQLALAPALWRRLGANLMALRSERIQPGVNQDAKAPPAYAQRQAMDLPEALTVQAGRAAYNAFWHWTGVDRERAKELLLLDRIDVLTPNGKHRLRQLRHDLNAITDRVKHSLPVWADLPTGGAFSRAVELGRKAFGLAGQRIYLVGLSRGEVEARGLAWEQAIVATGAAAARSALYAELMGCVELPPDCDLLAGVCLMAGPVNQADIGKQFYGYPDLLAQAYPQRDPTTLLVWTLKAKTIADPIGNEEQLLNPARKGPLVDLRPGPHHVVRVARDGRIQRLRQREDRVSNERAFADQGNFVTSPDGEEIPGNRGTPWPEAWRSELVW